MRDAVVVGGGVAGLACGRRLRALGADALVLEATARSGGKVATHAAGDLLVESGPESCMARPELLLALRELGVRVLERTRGERARWLVRGGRLVSPLRALSLGGLARAALGFVRRGAPPSEDESVEAYARRRFGEEAARRLFDPLVSGIFAGDPARLSYASALSGFGRRRGRSVRFEGGMEALPAALARSLGSVLRLGARVSAVEPEGDVWRVILDDGEAIATRTVVLACPADAAAALLRPLDPELAGELAGIRYAAVTTVSLAYRADAFPAGVPRGMGALVAREEGLPILGCLISAAPPGRVLLRAFVRGVDGAAESTAIECVGRLFGARLPPLVAGAFRHERAIPQYELGHAARLRAIGVRLERKRGLALAGNAYRGISVGDVMADAELVAEQVHRPACAKAAAVAAS